MAKKNRVRQRIQHKQQIKALANQIQVTQRRAEKIQQLPKDERNQAIYQAKKEALERAGYTKTQAGQYARRKSIDNYLEAPASPLPKKKLQQFEKAREEYERRRQEEERQRRLFEPKKKLLIFYRDLIGFVSEEDIHAHKKVFQYMDAESMMGSAKTLSQLDFGESPASEVQMYIVENEAEAKNAKSHLRGEGFSLVYEGMGDPRGYRSLVLSFTTMMMLLYHTSDKKAFRANLISHLRRLNENTAKRFRQDYSHAKVQTFELEAKKTK